MSVFFKNSGQNGRADFTNPFDPTATAFTVAAWIYPLATGQAAYISCIHNSGNTDWRALMRVAPSQVFGISRNGTIDKYTECATGTYLTASTWQHIAGSCPSTDFGDATEMKLYHDGSEVTYGTQNNGTSELTGGTGLMSQGARYYDDTRNFNGYAGEIAWWNRVLSDAEIAGLAKGFAPSFYPNALKSYVPFVIKDNAMDWITGDYPTYQAGCVVMPHPPAITYPSQPFILTPPTSGPTLSINVTPSANYQYTGVRIETP